MTGPRPGPSESGATAASSGAGDTRPNAAQDRTAQDRTAQDRAARDRAAQDEAAQDTGAQATQPTAVPPGGPGGAPGGEGGRRGRWRRPGPQQVPPPPPAAKGMWRADGSPMTALPNRMSVRLRLTLLYGLLFFMAGALLLFVMSFLMANILSNVKVIGYGLTDAAAAELQRQFVEQTMKQLVGRSLLALGGVGVITLVLGWFVADRALSPLQRVTTTARRLSESTLHERIALEGPEDEIKELADTFDAMLERLGQAFDSQRRFVANASHELRTPLAINRTLLEVALGDPEASEDLRTVGRTLLATNARHERLIEGLLLLARSERELTARTPVDMAEVAAAVLEQSARRDHDNDVAVHPELTRGTALGDPVLLEHLVSNLVENAIKHNEAEGGELWIRTGMLDGYATVQVENTGPVVPAYEVERLFEPFRRLNADRVESSKGAGLGLSIVRSVVLAHRGAVYAAPRPGGGLIVTVRLPPG
ncbi:Signal transduction histidine kinase [Actinomadura meyerae]|uniref:histidine kinase n=1 Tax=Actinomadura meyerae TaxID=240840 RepID=A0A239G5W9_9ACTN|nr:HAMP domain-containing sensor histidine kinase [Actinomadura meyerae]SNS64500.1 Signal transduction histidine kinase [Actinomadura meyerae]